MKVGFGWPGLLCEDTEVGQGEVLDKTSLLLVPWSSPSESWKGGGGGQAGVPGWEPRALFCNHNMISCAEQQSRSRQGEADRPGWLPWLELPSSSGSWELLWNSLSACCFHAFGCECHPLPIFGGRGGSSRGREGAELLSSHILGTAGDSWA